MDETELYRLVGFIHDLTGRLRDDTIRYGVYRQCGNEQKAAEMKSYMVSNSELLVGQFAALRELLGEQHND